MTDQDHAKIVREALDSAAKAFEAKTKEDADRIQHLEQALIAVRVNLMRSPDKAHIVGAFVAAILSGDTMQDAVLAAEAVSRMKELTP